MEHPLRDQEGFTLIELIVAVGIIAVLAAVAIPQYATYKSRAVDNQMQSALKNARTAMEAYYVETQEYTTDVNLLVVNGYNDTATVTLNVLAATATDYDLRACAPGGSFTSWEFSTTGANAGKTLGSGTACS